MKNRTAFLATPATLAIYATLIALFGLAGCRPTPPPEADNAPAAAEQQRAEAQQQPAAGPRAAIQKQAAAQRAAAEERAKQAREARARLEQARPTGPAPGEIPAPPDVAAPPVDARKTASGLASKVIAKGKGKVNPKPENVVEVHYTGWTTDGKMFDSSHKRGKPSRFPLNRVIPGWTEGVQLMVEGEKRRFWIPQDLAYRGRPGPPQGMLVFDVELLSIVR